MHKEINFENDTEQAPTETEMVTLSARDWDVFAKSLDDTEAPRPKLAAAMNRHRDGQTH